VPLLVAAVIWLLPHAGFAPRSWGLLCLFAATICAMITRPMPAGSTIVIVISLGMLLRLVTVQDALSGFSNVTVWLIVAAFLFARGFTQTRLGERIAYTIVRRLGRGPLRLGYSIALADLVMAPLTPSNTARAGGILFPVTLNVARAFGSEPGPTADRIGAFLMKTLFQTDLVVSAMFLTATAPNPLGRGIRPAGLRRGIVVDDVGARGVGPRRRGPGRRAVRRLPSLPARGHRHNARTDACRQPPA